MKKRFSMVAIALLVLSALVLVACGGSGASSSSGDDASESKYVGTWKADSMALKDDSEELGDDWQIVVNADGTGQSITAEETEEFTWSPTKDGFKTKGDLKVTFKDDGDNIKTKILGVDIIFVKQ